MAGANRILPKDQADGYLLVIKAASAKRSIRETFALKLLETVIGTKSTHPKDIEELVFEVQSTGGKPGALAVAIHYPISHLFQPKGYTDITLLLDQRQIRDRDVARR